MQKWTTKGCLIKLFSGPVGVVDKFDTLQSLNDHFGKLCSFTKICVMSL